MSEKLNKQEIIAKVREHFSQPGAQLAIRTNVDHNFPDEAQCVYRGGFDPTSPLRCAFGVLIPDEAYEPSMEGSRAQAVVDDNPHLKNLFESDVYDGNEFFSTFLNRLQRVHDDIANAKGTVSGFLASLADFEDEELKR